MLRSLRKDWGVAMDKKRTIFDFLGSVFMIYGITVTLLIGITYFLGSIQNSGNTMLVLGNIGLSTTLLLQFLFISFINIGLQYLFHSDWFIKEGSHRLRTALMLISILLVMSLLIHLFNWFPKNDWLPWLLFFSFFILSSIVSILVISWKEKLENKQMEEGLKRFKNKLKEDQKNV